MLTANENARDAEPTAVPGAKQSTHNKDHLTPPKGLRKWVRLLNALLAGRSLNRFEAARDPAIADSCLNSSVSELEGRGIKIDRASEIVPGRHGIARCNRYRINRDPANLARAQALLRVVPGGQCIADALEVV